MNLPHQRADCWGCQWQTDSATRAHSHLSARNSEQSCLGVTQSGEPVPRTGSAGTKQTGRNTNGRKTESEIRMERQNGKYYIQVKPSLLTGRRASHVFQTIGSQMAVRLSALRAGRLPFNPRKIPGTHFC
jgi:hypothetical protein